jgi:hypothetical protein
MNSVSLVTANTPLVTTPVTTTVPVSEDKTVGSLANSPASVVMLGQNDKVTDATTYSSRGSLADTDPVYSLEKDVQNAVTRSLIGNLSTTATAGRFQGLGATLLEQLAKDGSTSISQSVIRSAAGDVKDAAALKSAQAELHGKADNTITLTLKTASGATITLNLSTQDDGLAVQANVTGGRLSEEERAALGSLADAFQGAIDGLTAKPPRLNLGSLGDLDPEMFSSIELSASLKLGKDQFQTLSFKADEQNRSINMSGPTGTIALDVDNNSAILGNAQQQAAAVKSYLEQFDAAQKRGDGDKNLMTLFKDAFSTLQTTTKSLSSTSGPALTNVDRSILSGLADFDVSLTQTTQYLNPMRSAEEDKFAYKSSQSTETKGTSSADRSVEQKQTSSLNASYHTSIYPGTALALSKDAESQNYAYHQIEDTASSTTRIGYAKGKLIEASFTQTASQSTNVVKYEMGRLVDTVSTPKEVDRSYNLMGMIDEALRNDRNSRVATGKSTLEDELVEIHAKVLLRATPFSKFS